MSGPLERMNVINAENSTRRPLLKLQASQRGRPVPVWWVQCIGRRPPRVVHTTKESALAECRRLSELPGNHGLIFQVRESRFVASFSNGEATRS